MRPVGGHRSIIGAKLTSPVHLARLSPPWYKNGPDKGAVLIVVLSHIFSLGEFDEFASLRDRAREAAALGASAIYLEEVPDSELDPVVVLAALAATLPSISLGMMLSTRSGRAPSVLAKLLSGIDLVSGGRAHLLLGDLNDPPGENLRRTEEQVELIKTMLANDATTFDGLTYHVDGAWNTPRMNGSPPVADKVVIACSPTQLHWMNEHGARDRAPFVVGLERRSLDQFESIIETALEGSGESFIGALIDVEDGLEPSLNFAKSIADRLLVTHIRWRSLPSRSDLERCARML